MVRSSRPTLHARVQRKQTLSGCSYPNIQPFLDIADTFTLTHRLRGVYSGVRTGSRCRSSVSPALVSWHQTGSCRIEGVSVGCVILWPCWCENDSVEPLSVSLCPFLNSFERCWNKFKVNKTHFYVNYQPKKAKLIIVSDALMQFSKCSVSQTSLIIY